MDSVSTKLSNLLGCFGCLLPIIGFTFLALALFQGAGWRVALCGVILLPLAIPLFARANTLEGRRLEKQKTILASLQSSLGTLQNNRTWVSSDALTRITIHETSRQISCWHASDELGKPVKTSNVHMSYEETIYGFRDLESVAMVENSEVIGMAFTSTNSRLLEYIKLEMTDKLPKEIAPDKVRQLALVLQTRDETHPFYQVNFIKDRYTEIELNSPAYEKAFNDLHLLFTTLNPILTDPFQPTVIEGDRLGEQRSGTGEEAQSTFKSPSEIQGVKKEPNELETTSEFHDYKEVESSSPPELEVSENEAAGTALIGEDHSFTEAPISDSNELSYFEKLVAKNKKQLAGKGTREEK